MMKILMTLFTLLTATHAQARPDDSAAPRMDSVSLTKQLETDGPKVTAERLTQSHNWAILARDIARDDASLPPPLLNSLLSRAPADVTPMLQAALRTRLQHDALDGLSVIVPASSSPFAGAAICGNGTPSWQKRIAPMVTETHNVVLALQRQDCLNALKTHPAG
ncbi:hypothetical protein AA0488_0077 [Kozakia baliensis NRIC 0488]|uniref:Uncharacterized protein n=2 Tax=Kozakia baliensis TaxID=153496 RepID=A0A1D8UQZ8_9PROT|nr:hypothetical protein A0U89_01745 [Kozakia baliensis]AOX19031.1 hypothetical protein A0U90_00490 [Kozakia baliensis]GBR23206.1 hypothetical protein AA0488_0077 [Kozakia baliensis NRIC 0488]GEL65102.1 hypothetical protein KBA01_23880 [Kozakia baliensis]